MKTAISIIIEYVDGLLAIEDRLILQYSDSPKAVNDIKANWQQLNMIKEAAIKLKDAEKQQIINAHNQGRSDRYNDFGRDGDEYYNQTYNEQ